MGFIQISLLVVFVITLVVLFVNILSKDERKGPVRPKTAQPEEPYSGYTEPETGQPAEDPPAEDETINELLAVIDEKFNRIDQTLETMRNEGFESARSGTETLKNEISVIESSFLQKASTHSRQKEHLQKLVKEITVRIQNYQKQFAQNRYIESAEKQKLESKLQNLKLKIVKDEDNFEDQINLLESALAGLDEMAAKIKDKPAENLHPALVAKLESVGQELERIGSARGDTGGEDLSALRSELAALESEIQGSKSLLKEQKEAADTLIRDIFKNIGIQEKKCLESRRLSSDEKKKLLKKLSDLKNAEPGRGPEPACEKQINLLRGLTDTLEKTAALIEEKSKQPEFDPELASLVMESLDNKYREIDNTLASARENNSFSREELDKIKYSLESIPGDTLREIAIRQEYREQLRNRIDKILDSIIKHEQQINNDRDNYLNEKKELQQQLNKLRARGEKELSEYNSQIQGLRDTLTRIKKSGMQEEVKEIEEEVLRTSDILKNVKDRFDTQTHFHREQLLEKDKEFLKFQAKLPNVVSMIEKQKQRNLEDIRKQNNALREEINRNKHEIELQNLETEKEKDSLITELENLKNEESSIEEEKVRVEHFISYRKRLENEVSDLLEKIKLREQRFLQECRSKDNEIKKLSQAIESKEKAVHVKWLRQEKTIQDEKKQLELTLRNLKSQKGKIKTSGRQNITELKREIGTLQKHLDDKQRELSEFKRERKKAEKVIKSSLSSEMKSLKSKFDKQTSAIESKLKEKNNEIYTLKARLTIREDKLKMDIEKKRQMQQKMVDELKAMEDSMRLMINNSIIKAEDKIQPYRKQVESLRAEIDTTEKNFREEQAIVENIQQERMKLEKNLSSLEKDLEQNMHKFEELIDLKRKHIDAIGREITEKEKLMKITQIEDQKLTHMDMLQKYGSPQENSKK